MRAKSPPPGPSKHQNTDRQNSDVDSEFQWWFQVHRPLFLRSSLELKGCIDCFPGTYFHVVRSTSSFLVDSDKEPSGVRLITRWTATRSFLSQCSKCEQFRQHRKLKRILPECRQFGGFEPREYREQSRRGIGVKIL